MIHALIGHTGFVGSNLLRAQRYDGLFNSTNIAEIRGKRFERVVCAGAYAAKWLANKDPAADLAGIETLIDHLSTISVGRFILISTIDVYSSPVAVTEVDRPIPNPTQAYGMNRLLLEDFVTDHFDVHHIVRLPALYGPGLKKNAIYDLVHDNGTQLINPESRFQWYPVSRLARDIGVLESSAISLINMATEPVAMEEIRRRFFPQKAIGGSASPAIFYDMKTRYDSLLGGSNGYFFSSSSILGDMASYLSGGT